MSGTKPTAVQQTTIKNRIQSDNSHGFRSMMSQTKTNESKTKEENKMAFFNSAVGVLQTLVVALGAGLGIWGAINLLEGYGNDNPGANAHVR